MCLTAPEKEAITGPMDLRVLNYSNLHQHCRGTETAHWQSPLVIPYGGPHQHHLRSCRASHLTVTLPHSHLLTRAHRVGQKPHTACFAAWPNLHLPQLMDRQLQVGRNLPGLVRQLRPFRRYLPFHHRVLRLVPLSCFLHIDHWPKLFKTSAEFQRTPPLHADAPPPAYKTYYLTSECLLPGHAHCLSTDALFPLQTPNHQNFHSAGQTSAKIQKGTRLLTLQRRSTNRLGMKMDLMPKRPGSMPHGSMNCDTIEYHHIIYFDILHTGRICHLHDGLATLVLQHHLLMWVALGCPRFEAHPCCQWNWFHRLLQICQSLHGHWSLCHRTALRSRGFCRCCHPNLWHVASFASLSQFSITFNSSHAPSLPCTISTQPQPLLATHTGF